MLPHLHLTKGLSTSTPYAFARELFSISFRGPRFVITSAVDDTVFESVFFILENIKIIFFIFYD
jgi:hypothetical protein